MKKTTVLLIAFITLLICFVGCANGTPETTTGETLPETLPETEASSLIPDEPVLISDGKPVFTIIRPSDAPDTLIKFGVDIAKNIREISGCSAQGISEDWYMEGKYDPNSYEILVGFTNREESLAVLNELAFDDYAIAFVNTKLVIAAHNSEKLREACDYFISHIEQKKNADGKDECVYSGGEHFSKTDNAKYLFNAQNTLDGYTIVCDTNDNTLKKAANTLSSDIKSAYGVKLEIKDISTEATEKEIILGKEGRSECANLGTIPENSYKIIVSGKKLIIGGDSSAAAAFGASYLSDMFIEKYYSNMLAIEQSISLCDKYVLFTDSPKRAGGTDIRVMSFNLLCELWNDKPPVAGRDVIVDSIFRYYSPDVIGIQEVSDGWYAALRNCFGTDYAFTDMVTPKGQTNFSTLAYDKRTVKLIEHGVTLFSQGNDMRLRLVTWGLFEKIDSGKRFIVLSTHWDLGSNLNYQKIHASEMADMCKEFEEKYNLPIITTGDYNSNESTEPYKIFVQKTGYTEAKHTADTINRACKTYHTLGVAVSTAKADSIDHIFGSDKVHFLYYNVLVDETTTNASDHNPIYADIKLN